MRTQKPEKYRFAHPSRCSSESILDTECAWHKELHLLILVRPIGPPPKTLTPLQTRQFYRMGILNTRDGYWWGGGDVAKTPFDLGGLTLFVPNKRVQQIRRELGLPCGPDKWINV